MSFIEKSREAILLWDTMFPLDREYREKHNISLWSKKHLQICQIDIYHAYLEDKMYDEYLKQGMEDHKNEQEYKKGKIIKERSLPPEESEAIFQKLRSNMFQSIKVED